MNTDDAVATPSWVMFLGRLGLLPFLAPSLAGWFWPAIAPSAGLALTVYAALILSFLAGARWGMAVNAPLIDNRIVSLAMLPSLAGFALLLLPPEWRGWQLAGLGAAHAFQGFWDLRASSVPVWYARLRGQLTIGALVGLTSGVVVFGT